tara:strand:- start:8669 stop:9154 length:486 start_codon:yes stop_codon:yes gene_type:complete
MKVPKTYIPTILSKKDKKTVKKGLKKSIMNYKNGKYVTRKKVKSFKSKKSKHILNAEKIYKIKNLSINRELVKKTKCSKKTLDTILRKGLGAYYSSGSRPNQTPHSWGYARLASAITGGKASSVDYKLLENGCHTNSLALKLAKKTKQIRHHTRKIHKVLL